MTILRADVLVIGGGMAAAWAAIAAAQAGASVVMVDKGAVGTSGVTANGGPNHWWVPPDPGLRRVAVERQAVKACGLGDPEWMARIIDLTWRHLPEIAPFYPFGSDGNGGRYIPGVRGPEYMRALRRMALGAGVAILDHHPAVELIADRNGAVRGARGIALSSEDVWEVRAGATIMATGGCAFRSGLLGSHTNTGDGLLMAAEAGADLSGMEFAPSWSLSPRWASTRTLPYPAARFFDAQGYELDIPPPGAGHRHNQALGRAMLAGEVLADLRDAPAPLPDLLRTIQPLTLAAFERHGIDPFGQRFPVRLYGEGTIRGTGGLRVIDDACRTTAPGLFAVGDAATRELVAGANSGGGSVNAAWALSSGRIAGVAAAREAQTRRGASQPRTRGLGRSGMRPRKQHRPLGIDPSVAAIGAAVHGYGVALWRDAASLGRSLESVERQWDQIADHARASGRALVDLRAHAAMAVTARWHLHAAMARTESRGLHVREDASGMDANQSARLLVGGLDAIWTRPERYISEEVAA